MSSNKLLSTTKSRTDYTCLVLWVTRPTKYSLLVPYMDSPLILAVTKRTQLRLKSLQVRREWRHQERKQHRSHPSAHPCHHLSGLRINLEPSELSAKLRKAQLSTGLIDWLPDLHMANWFRIGLISDSIENINRFIQCSVNQVQDLQPLVSNIHLRQRNRH